MQHTVHRYACVKSYGSLLLRSGLTEPELDMDIVSIDGGWMKKYSTLLSIFYRDTRSMALPSLRLECSTSRDTYTSYLAVSTDPHGQSKCQKYVALDFYYLLDLTRAARPPLISIRVFCHDSIVRDVHLN